MSNSTAIGNGSTGTTRQWYMMIKASPNMLCILFEHWRRKRFSFQAKLAIFPVGAVCCHRTMNFFTSIPDQIIFLCNEASVKGQCSWIDWCIIAWLGVYSTSCIFQMPDCQTDQHAFLHCCCVFWKISSWYRNSRPSLNQTSVRTSTPLSCCGQHQLLPKGVQETLPWSVMDFCSLRSFPRAIRDLHMLLTKRVSPTVCHARIICSLTVC